ncbi:MAG: OmpA family protein [Microbacterium sp.]|jgi:OOP family OmpA-OmpF porin|nr:OmpA family protein [Microbacterium sp.]
MTTAQLRGLRPLLTAASAGIVAAIALTGCAAEAPQAPKTEPTKATAKPASAPAVPGYEVGQFPPVPLFVLPDLSLLDTSASAFTIEVNTALADIPGVTASPAHCDGGGKVISGNGTAYLYGDGSGSFTGPDGSVQNFGDGSGNSTINGVAIQNFGDGSGNYTDGEMKIQNYGDGSGDYSAAGVRIQNFGDGSGNYSDGEIKIQNYGDGTAKVNGKTVKAAPIPGVPQLGVFPPLAALAPLKSCGTVLTFADGVLFDFDRSEIRADAAKTLDTVAKALTELDVAQAAVSGHTDALGSDDYNQTLSEKRAASVVADLRDRGVKTDLTSEGFGESRPVAPNEVDGADNPAGRQLNRRVEIFIPAAL